MIVEQNNHKRPSLIEDVVAPHTEAYTNPNREEVRRRSIGNLHQQYLRSKLPKRSLWRKPATARFGEPVKISPQPKYQIVPPLRTFPSLYPDHPLPGISTFSNNAVGNMKGSRNWVVNQFRRFKYVLVLAWLSIAGWFHSVALKTLPKRYTAASGMVIDWQAKSLSRIKTAVPLLLVLFLLSAAAWLSPAHLPRTLGGETNNAKLIPTTIRQSNASQNSGNSGSSNNNSGPDPAPLPSSNAGTDFQQPLGSSPGGLGGSDTGVQVVAPAPIPEPVNSAIPTASVAIPPTQVQVGDKPVLDVSGINFTVN